MSAQVGAGRLQRKIASRLQRKHASRLVQREAGASGVGDHAPHAVAAAQGGSGEPLPAAVQGRFESSLGTGLGGVRVHAGAASNEAAASVGALAYTTGQDIHFGRGQYDPGSKSGQELLAHEVAHTVQQRGAGPMSQDKLEVSEPGDSLEHEADSAAAAMVQGRPASVAPAAGLSRKVIQRAIGFEFEFGSWQSTHSNNQSRLAKGEVISDQTSYKIEGEDAESGKSAVEFVFKPLLTKGEAKTEIGKADAIAAELHNKTRTYQGFDITPGETKAKMQASPAIPLDKMVEFYKLSTQDGLSKRMGGGSKAQEDIFEKHLGQGVKASPELRGFLILIVNYMTQGMLQGRLNYPKSAVMLMARTSFTKMYSLLPEHDFFQKQENAGKWVDLVMETFTSIVDNKAQPKKEDVDKRSSEPAFNMRLAEMENVGTDQGKAQEAYKLKTTRKEWVENMPDHDELSKGKDKRFEGMGAYGTATDRLKEPEQNKPNKPEDKPQDKPQNDEQVDDKLLQSSVEKAVEVGVQAIQAHPDVEVVDDEDDTNQKGEQQPKPQDNQPKGPNKEAPLFEIRGAGDMFGLSPDAKIGTWVNKAEEIFDVVDKATGGLVYGLGPKPQIAPDVDSPGIWEKQAPQQQQAPQQAPQQNQAPKQNAKPPKKKKKKFWPFSGW